MRIIEGDLMDITSGIIVQQVNCQNTIGAGLSGAIIKKYPLVKERYHKLCTGRKPKELFGLCLPVKINEDLTIVSSFSQLYYGNALKTFRVYTDENTLVHNIKRIVERYKNRQVYLPWKIGCGLAGGNWDSVLERIKDLPVIIVRPVN